MRLKKIGFVPLIVLLGLLFSSCEKDLFWVERRTLIYDSFQWNPPPRTNSRGIVKIDLEMDIRDISNRFRAINRISMFDSYFLVSSRAFRPGDRPFLNLTTENGSRVYRGRLLPTNNMSQFMIDVSDRNYAIFVENLFQEVRRFGNTMLYIDIETGVNQSGLVYDFEFFNNLNVEIRR